MGGRRGPIIAGAGAAALLVLVAVILVLPKLGQVKDANAALQQAQSQQGTLGSQLAALKQAQTDAPKNREIIRKVQQAIPPTVDQQGFFLLLENAALQSGIDVVTVTPNSPAFDATTGLTTITNGVSVSGSYFALTEFLFRIETLPRAAKVISVSLAPGGGTTGSSGAAAVGTLTMSTSVDIYTSDTSAGPGSTPGPTDASGGISTTGTTPTTPSTASPAAFTTGA